MRALEVIVGFSREMAGAVSPEQIHAVLADAAVTLGCPAAAVLAVEAPGEVALAAAAGLPAALLGWRAQADVVDDELARQLLSDCQGRFRAALCLPLVAGGDLYGGLIVFEDERPLDAQQRSLVVTLADVAATALGKAFQFADLSRSYADLQASREALARTEKLRALGQMAAGVAHDLVNILFPIQLSAKFVRGRLPPELFPEGSEVRQSLDHMESVIKRGMDTVQRLRDFSRQSPDRPPATADLGGLVHEVAAICKPRLSTRLGHVRMEVSVLPTPPVLLQASECVAALMNLVVNAIDAAAQSPSGKGLVRLDCGADAGGAWVRVQDNGPGIPDELRARIYEPFFTTKGDEGTGLGLSMVWAFVRRHGAQLDLESRPGQGARFTVRFSPEA